MLNASLDPLEERPHEYLSLQNLAPHYATVGSFSLQICACIGVARGAVAQVN